MRTLPLVIISIWASTWLTTPLWASTPQDACTAIRLDAPGESMEHVPVRDQKSTGLCYAYSGASMIDAYRFSHPSSAPAGTVPSFTPLTSPVEAAVGAVGMREQIFNAGDGEYDFPFMGGKECDIVNYLRRNGSCPDPRTEKLGNYASLISAYQLYLSYQIDLAEVRRIMSRQSYTKHDWKDAGPYSGVTDQMGVTVENLRSLLRKDGVDPQLIPSSAILVEFLGQEQPMLLIKMLLLEACEGSRIRVHAPACVQAGATPNALKPQEFREFVRQSLSSPVVPHQPLAAGYCIGVLDYGPAFRGIDRSHPERPIPTADCAEGHSSLLIGRRWNTARKTCQLLVQNTYGASCDGYWENWDCEKDGKIWVDEDAIAENSLTLAVLR